MISTKGRYSIRILLDLAKTRGCHIGAIYKEVVSGETISARPVMQQLLHEVESVCGDGVLVVEWTSGQR